MREDCGFGKAKEMPRVGIGSVPDLVDNGNAFKTMDALRKQEKELRGKIDTMEVCAGGGGGCRCHRVTKLWCFVVAAQLVVSWLSLFVSASLFLLSCYSSFSFSEATKSNRFRASLSPISSIAG